MNVSELAKFYKGKRVFLTGHTGFKGSWLVCLLKKFGADVCGYSLAPYTTPNMFGLVGAEKLVSHNIGDVRDLANLKKVMGGYKPDIVLHLAAQPIVITGYNDPVYTYEVNVMGTVNVLEAARGVPSVKSIVNVTTDKVYLNEDKGRAFIESDPMCGYDPYSNSKSCSELVTYSYAKSFFHPDKFSEHGVCVSTARAGNVLGGGDWSDYRVVSDFAKSKATNTPMVVRNPYATRPWQHVLEPNLLYLIIAMKQFNNPSFSGSYNIGPDIDNCVTVTKVLDSLKKADNKFQYVVKKDPNAVHEAVRLELSNQKIKDVFGYKKIYDIEKTTEAIAEWFSAYAASEDMQKFTLMQIDDFLKCVGG